MRHKLTLALLFLTGCPSPNNRLIHGTGTIDGQTSFTKSSVSIQNLATQEVVCQTQTDDKGNFSCDIAVASGDLVICAKGGTFTEIATNSPAPLDTSTYCSLIPQVKELEKRSITLTPWTALQYAFANAVTHKTSVALTVANPVAHDKLNAFLSCGQPDGQAAIDVVNAFPSVPTASDTTSTGLTPSLVNGILTGGLSFLGKSLSESKGMTPGITLTTPRILDVLIRDISDSVFDGKENGAQLDLFGIPLTSSFLRADLAYAIRDFLVSDRNNTHATPKDLGNWMSCLSSHKETLFADTGAVFDDQGPQLAFDVPQNHSVVSGIFQVHVSASDRLGVKNLQFTGNLPFLTVPVANIQDKDADISASIDSSKLPEGELHIAASATDNRAFQSSAEIILTVDNQAPVINIVTPAKDATVKGHVTIEATASDPVGVANFSVLLPSGLANQPVNGNHLVTDWDTTQESDGLSTIRISATDAVTKKVATQEITVTIDNLLLGTVSGRISMESPVRNVTVQAVSYNGGLRHDVLAEMTTKNGDFVLTLPDTYAGPVLIRAFGTAALYANAVTGQDVAFLADDELLSVIDYAPSTVGTMISDVSVNGYTTLATHLADVYRSQGTVFAQAITHAFTLFGQHFDRPDGISIRSVRVADLSMNDATAQDASIKMGLAHAGLSRWGAEVSASENLALGTLPSLAVIRLLEKDLDDGFLDGLDSQQAPVWASSQHRTALTTDTLRWDLAIAIAKWLDNVPFPTGDSQKLNPTPLHSSKFSAPFGFLDTISSDNNTDLFRGASPRSFDRVGPTITVVPLSSGSSPVGGSVSVHVNTNDDSGVATLQVTAQGKTLFNSSYNSAKSPSSDIAIDTHQLTDGTVTLEIKAVDAFGNVSTTTQTIVVDNTPPTLSVLPPTWVNDQHATVTVNAADNIGSTTPAVFRIGTTTLIASSSNNTDYEVDLGTCDLNRTVVATIADEVGNTASQTFTINCDNTPPSMGFDTSVKYSPEASDRIVPITDFSGFDYVSFLAVTDYVADTIPKNIVKLFNRLDYLPGVNNNPVLLKFFVQNETKVTLSNVTYRYFKNGILKRDTTSAMPDIGNFSYFIPIAYQTLSADLAYTTPDDVHLIEITASDFASNTFKISYTFKLDVKVPPVIVRNCQVTDFLKNYSLKNANLDSIYTSGHNAPFTQGEILWPINLPADSLATKIPAQLKFLGADTLVTSITNINFEMIYTTNWANEPDPYAVKCLNTGSTDTIENFTHVKKAYQYEYSGYKKAGNCFGGYRVAGGRRSITRDNEHVTAFQILDRGIAQTPISSNLYNITPDATLNFTKLAVAPKANITWDRYQSPTGAFRYQWSNDAGRDLRHYNNQGIDSRYFNMRGFIERMKINSQRSLVTGTHPQLILYDGIPIIYDTSCNNDIEYNF
jgi:hypothetical protein